MSEAKHTPGPWWVRTREDRSGQVADCFVAANDVGGLPYDAEILGDDEYREDEGMARKLADSCLIAAAPELLDALNLILPLAKGYAAQNPVGGNAARIEQALAAITKATGEAF